MSVSQFKSFIPAFLGCESAAMALMNGTYENPSKTAFIEGHMLHAWQEDRLEEFKANNPDIYSSRGVTAGQLKSNFQHCNKMIEVLENDPMVLEVLSGQKEVIMTAELFGVQWKIMIDSYRPDVGAFADLKALMNMKKHYNDHSMTYENFIDYYGYNIQMAVYAEVERIANKQDQHLFPHIVVVTKEEIPDHEIIMFDHEDIKQGLFIVERHIERVKAVKSGNEEPIRCERCDYCKSTKKITKFKRYFEMGFY